MSNDNDWYNFARHADEWFANYASGANISGGVTMFTLGHSLELYLKAVLVKRTDDAEGVIKKNHKIANLWKDCKTDPKFLPDYSLDEKFLEHDDIFSIDHLDFEDQEDFKKFVEHRSVYIISNHLPDLKYGLTKWKTLSEGQRRIMAWGTYEPYWITLFGSIRKYLEFPDHKEPDFLRIHLDQGRFSEQAKNYLEGLYE